MYYVCARLEDLSFLLSAVVRQCRKRSIYCTFVMFRVLTGDVSCEWPAPDLLCFFPYGVFWDRSFLANLAHLHVAFNFISFAVVFYFLGIIKVGYGRYTQAISNLLYDLLPILFLVFLLTSRKCRNVMPQYSRKQDFRRYNIFTTYYACMNTQKSRALIRGKLPHF